MTIAGVVARAVVEPRTVDALARAVADLYAREKPFAFVGGATQIDLGNAPHAVDTIVKTTACNRVVDYAPQDQTITVEAGMTIADVTDVLRKQRQFLALDVPDPERTTIGGAVATNIFGRRRLRYGAIKDTIVGIEIVRPDGTRARGGGKVVKNVAGFDIPKLMVGSLGTLGAIVSATFRVYPIEEQSTALAYRGVDLEQLMQICSDLLTEQLVPAFVTAFNRPNAEQYDCIVGFEGFAHGVEQQMNIATSIAVRRGLTADALPGLPNAEVDAAERSVRRGAPWQVTVSAPPRALAAFLATPELGGMQRLIYPLLGVAFIAAPVLNAATIAHWRGKLADGSVVVNVMPHEARASVETWGTPRPAAFAIMRRLKFNFDPKGLCNRGRFVGGL